MLDLTQRKWSWRCNLTLGQDTSDGYLLRQRGHLVQVGTKPLPQHPEYSENLKSSTARIREDSP